MGLTEHWLDGQALQRKKQPRNHAAYPQGILKMLEQTRRMLRQGGGLRETETYTNEMNWTAIRGTLQAARAC